MNEQIKKLAEQCWINDGGPDSYFSQQKFAELIVRECMDNLAWHGHDEAVSQLNWFLHNKIRS